MKRLWLLFALLCTPTVAEEITLVIPQLAKGRAAEGDGLSARYDAAWTKYERAIGKVVADVTEALDAEFNKAADAGSLESADMWDKKKKGFLDSKTVTCEIPDKPKSSARKKPKPDAPTTFAKVLQSAQQETDNAVSALKNDYGTLISEYTKARNLERAKHLKEELEGLGAARAGRLKMAEPETDGLEALQGLWVATQVDRHGTLMTPDELRSQARRIIFDGDLVTFEETRDGNLKQYSGTVHLNTKEGTLDFDGRGPKGYPLRLLGIYRLNKDELLWSFRANVDGTAKRPTGYRADKESPNWSIAYRFKKEEPGK